MAAAGQLMRIAREVSRVLPAAFRDLMEGEPASARPQQAEEHERQSDRTGPGDICQPAPAGQSSCSGGAKDTRGAERPRKVEPRHVEFPDEREVKRPLTNKMAVPRLLEQDENPASAKLKISEVVSMMDDCMGAVVSEDADIMRTHIAMAKLLRGPESIRMGRKADMEKWMERRVVGRWSRTVALNAGMPFCRRRLVKEELLRDIRMRDLQEPDSVQQHGTTVCGGWRSCRRPRRSTPLSCSTCCKRLCT